MKNHTVQYKGPPNPMCKMVNSFENSLAKAELTVYGLPTA